MTTALVHSLPKWRHLPNTLPLEGAIRIEFQEGTPIFRAATSVHERIEILLRQQKEAKLTKEEVEELDRYEEIDDYLSLLNRVVRNLLQTQLAQEA